jgi:16S rRNA (cytosine967-C5)-methyltransferase
VLLTLEMSLYQILFLDRVPDHAVVNDGVELVKRSGRRSAAPFVNAILRRCLRERAEITKSPIPVQASTPGGCSKAGSASMGRCSAWHRGGAHRRHRRSYLRVGNATPPEGTEPTSVPAATDWFPVILALSASRTSARSPSCRYSICSLGCGFSISAPPPGNKTAQALETPLQAIASDLHLSRARLLEPLGIPVVVLDATLPLPFSGLFDRILVDAPCSGTGTPARNPEIELEPAIRRYFRSLSTARPPFCATRSRR